MILGNSKIPHPKTARDRFVEEATALGCAYILAPPTAVDPLVNLGSLGSQVGEAQLINGAGLGTGLVAGGASAIFDGANDYISIPWRTRTNLFAYPLPQAVTGWTRVGATGAGSIQEVALPAAMGGSGKVFRNVVTSESSGARATNAATCSPSTYQAVATFVKGTLGASIVLILREEKGAGELINARVVQTLTGTGEWQWASGGIKVAAECTSYKWECRYTAATTTGTIEFVVAMQEARATETVITEAEAFPFYSTLTSGLSGWSGTAFESVSDTGPWARGTSRTFIATINRSENVGANGIFGSGLATEGLYWLRGGVANETFTLGYTATAVGVASWANTIPLNKTETIALVLNPTTKATLFVNGVSKGEITVEARPAATNQGLYLGTARNVWAGRAIPFAVALKALAA